MKKEEDKNAKMSAKEEIKHLKMTIAGQKGRLQQLSKELLKWKDYGKEADELNEKRISEIDEQTKIIEGLNSQVKQLSDSSKEQCEKIKNLREELVVANANLEYYKELPWFKRIFFKG